MEHILYNRVLEVMETIDDDCDEMDVVFVSVKVSDHDHHQSEFLPK